MQSNITVVRRLVAAAMLILGAAPGLADPLTDALDPVGGSKSASVLGSGNLYARSFTDGWRGSQVRAARYFKATSKEDLIKVSEIAFAGFDAGCHTRRGSILGTASSSVMEWLNVDAIERRLLQTRNDYGYDYATRVAICARSDAENLGGMIIVSREGQTQAEMAIFIMKGSAFPIVSDATARRQRATEQDQRAAERADFYRRESASRETRALAYRKTIDIGSRTNCGLVISTRGTLVEVQLKAPTGFAAMLPDAPKAGTRAFIARDELYPENEGQTCGYDGTR
jgi:hypothetical protein